MSRQRLECVELARSGTPRPNRKRRQAGRTPYASRACLPAADADACSSLRPLMVCQGWTRQRLDWLELPFDIPQSKAVQYRNMTAAAKKIGREFRRLPSPFTMRAGRSRANDAENRPL